MFFQHQSGLFKYRLVLTVVEKKPISYKNRLKIQNKAFFSKASFSRKAALKIDPVYIDFVKPIEIRYYNFGLRKQCISQNSILLFSLLHRD